MQPALWGAITADYVMSKYGADGPYKWAIAGRSETKLTALKGQLGEGAKDLPTIVANSDDEASLEACLLYTSPSPRD